MLCLHQSEVLAAQGVPAEFLARHLVVREGVGAQVVQLRDAQLALDEQVAGVSGLAFGLFIILWEIILDNILLICQSRV